MKKALNFKAFSMVKIIVIYNLYKTDLTAFTMRSTFGK